MPIANKRRQITIIYIFLIIMLVRSLFHAPQSSVLLDACRAKKCV